MAPLRAAGWRQIDLRAREQPQTRPAVRRKPQSAFTFIQTAQPDLPLSRVRVLLRDLAAQERLEAHLA
jgi:hypothetical protein